MIVYGIWDTAELREIMELGKNLRIKNFDIVRMNNEGIITLIFASHQEAADFGNFLMKEKGYQIEITFIRELYDIPETDENERNQTFNQHCNSDGQANSFNRESPVHRPGMNSGTMGKGFF